MSGFEWSFCWFLTICVALYVDGMRPLMPSWLRNTTFIVTLIIAAEFGYFAGAAGVISQ